MDREQAERLVAACRRALLTPDGEVIMSDLRDFAMMDKQAGSQLSHAECAYRNGLQDFYRYLDALISD